MNWIAIINIDSDRIKMPSKLIYWLTQDIAVDKRFLYSLFHIFTLNSLVRNCQVVLKCSFIKFCKENSKIFYDVVNDLNFWIIKTKYKEKGSSFIPHFLIKHGSWYQLRQTIMVICVALIFDRTSTVFDALAVS